MDLSSDDSDATSTGARRLNVRHGGVHDACGRALAALSLARKGRVQQESEANVPGCGA